jgi:biotin carboxylase
MRETAAKNVFVLGLDDLHLGQLEALRRAAEYRFHALYRREDVKSGREDVARRVLEGARETLDRFPGPIDAVVGYWDFPVSTMLQLLRRDRGLPTPSFESVLKCEHKYWSRLEQVMCVPRNVPRFCAVDPFAEDAAARITVAYPFWIKPVRSVLSYLGYRVHDVAELRRALAEIRTGIARIATPFNYLLGFADLPPEVAAVDGRHCIAESMISGGRQCTLEGYAHGGEVVVYGAVDSIREGRHRSSFSRYQYPSTLPEPVLDRMSEITRRFLTRIGFDDSPFNVEFFWDERTDRISLLEFNVRISKSHCPLFKMVDGEFHHQVMLDVAMGRRQDFPYRRGEHAIAAKFMWRSHEDAIVRRAPDADEVAALCQEFPGMEIELHVHEGMRLSDLLYQDSYSYEVAVIVLGGNSEADLLRNYDRCRTAMDLRLETVPARHAKARLP